mmetsp:Transcript_22228/g.28752  ORF Transcript_22228/g.28752 Transcript_22228/m.28752 type:complete len:456 (-) Transcript_22228:222-1589(-)|eukprot:CAMPEP_0198152444 /NCGR_PEP_ID=MMETSP1443-20131203/59854_1 /TAXON_ID=186043 /ORGANISM="Entomoneis sp., Strain CCMP2396" /LENGTH=455 /DNA_ID=CAMNT_0043818473 /DNA_START=79 /DNA_END=1446 /DNA_ORIENTATION=+
MDNFYDGLNLQIDALQQTGTFIIDYTLPLDVSKIRTMAFRLNRRGRSSQIKKLEICQCNLVDKEDCLSELEHLITSLTNLKEFSFEEKDQRGQRGNLTSADLGRLVFSSQTLEKLSLDSGLNLHDSPGCALSVCNPGLLRELDVEFIGNAWQFTESLSGLEKLEVLKVGTKNVSNEFLASLLDCISGISQLSSLRIRYWGHIAFSSETIKLLSKIILGGKLKMFHLHSIFTSTGGVFINHEKEFQEFTVALRECKTLQGLHLVGDLGLKEPAVLDIFHQLREKRSLSSLSVDQRKLSISLAGWRTILQCLAKSDSLSGVSICTDLEDNSLLQTIVKGLQNNTSITHFALRAEDSQACSCTYCCLGDLARRNECLKLAKKLLPKQSFPDSLLPRAIVQLDNLDGKGSAIYTAIKNFSGMFILESQVQLDRRPKRRNHGQQQQAQRVLPKRRSARRT